MTVLVLWSMGLLMLHEQVERLLGVDLFGDPQQLGNLYLPTVEILSEGVLAEGRYDQVRAVYRAAAPEEDDAP